MYWTDSQILIVIGLALQSLSVLYQARKVFHLFMSYKEKKNKYIEEEVMGKEFHKAISQREKDWFWTLFLFFIGLVLQGVAEFVR